MKNISINVNNGSTEWNKRIKLHSATGNSKVIGTAISTLFQFNDRLRKYGADHFKATDNLAVVITANGDSVLDTYEINSEYGFKLKFGKASKSKKRFASCLHDLTVWASEDTHAISLEDLVKTFED